MGRKKVLIAVCSFLVCTSCLLFKNYYHTPQGGVRPKRPKFSLAKHPYKLKFTDVIDTNAIYFKIDSLENMYKEKHTLFQYYRFFSNGRLVLNGTINRMPTLKDCNNLSGSEIGYYKIENNTLTIEYFIYSIHSNGYYQLGKVQIIGDSIQYYKRLKVEGLKGTPDW